MPPRAAAAPGLAVPPGNGAGSGPAAEARLAAELAEERHVALELQRAILPLHDEAFDLPGLRTMVRYLPASPAGRVGGDWYITADMPGGHVLIAIGDVAGHGLAAAAGMARLRGALAGLAITGSPPERLVGWLNDLVRHVAPEHTASVIAGYFDPASRTLTWAQAGHPPPVLVRDSWARPLDPPPGILLGAGDEEYAAATLALAPRGSAAAVQRRADRAPGPVRRGRGGHAGGRRARHRRPGARHRRRAAGVRRHRLRGRHLPGGAARAVTVLARGITPGPPVRGFTLEPPCRLLGPTSRPSHPAYSRAAGRRGWPRLSPPQRLAAEHERISVRAGGQGGGHPAQ